MKTYLKAIVAGLIAAIAFATPTVDDGLKASEVLGIVSSFLVGTGVVYAVPNKPKTESTDGTSNTYGAGL